MRNEFFYNWSAHYARDIWDAHSRPWQLFPADSVAWKETEDIVEHDKPCADSFVRAYKTTRRCKFCMSKELYLAVFDDPVMRNAELSVIPLSPVTFMKNPFLNMLFREMIYHSIDVEDIHSQDTFESSCHAVVTRIAYGVYFDTDVYARIEFRDDTGDLKIVLY